MREILGFWEKGKMKNPNFNLGEELKSMEKIRLVINLSDVEEISYGRVTC